MITAIALGALLLTMPVQASTVSVDTIIMSTVSDLAGSSGLLISTPAYLISGGSLTLQGSAGFIAGQSSITAASFWGDGSHLSGISSLGSNLTWGGPALFSSSFTVQNSGASLSLSTSSTISNVSVSASGVTSFFPEFHNSSSTIIADYATSNGNCGPCVSGSTLTISTSGGGVEIVFSGALNNAYMYFLEDGQYVPNLRYDLPIRNITNANMFSAGISTRLLLSPPPAGVHSYCLSICEPQSGGGAELLNDVSNADIFFVKELK